MVCPFGWRPWLAGPARVAGAGYSISNGHALARIGRSRVNKTRLLT
jgi:hypothetical protein